MTQTLWDVKECLHGRTRVDDDNKEWCEWCGKFLGMWPGYIFATIYRPLKDTDTDTEETSPCAP